MARFKTLGMVLLFTGGLALIIYGLVWAWSGSGPAPEAAPEPTPSVSSEPLTNSFLMTRIAEDASLISQGHVPAAVARADAMRNAYPECQFRAEVPGPFKTQRQAEKHAFKLVRLAQDDETYGVSDFLGVAPVTDPESGNEYVLVVYGHCEGEAYGGADTEA